MDIFFSDVCIGSFVSNYVVHKDPSIHPVYTVDITVKFCFMHSNPGGGSVAQFFPGFLKHTAYNCTNDFICH